MSILCGWFQGLGIVIGGAIAFSANCAFAQITQDSTLPNNSQVTTQGNITIIEGGTQLESNLFHSFKEFSVLNGTTAEFKNTEGIQNIISRVTGKSISNIDGILKANGTANLFLINPNGIIFGTHASLNIGGSFIASTASSLNFADGTKFSATNPQTTPLLTVSVPIGLQFGATAAPIRNQSQASPGGAVNSLGEPVGLQVQPGKTLALVGGDVVLEGGNLTAASGRVELGSVAGNSLVNLKSTVQGWILGYEGVQNFQNIQLIQRTIDGSGIPSQVDVTGVGGGNIQLQGKSVELIGLFVILRNRNNGVGDGGELTINTRKLIVRDGAQVSTSTRGKGAGGNLTINASESVELIGSFTTPDNFTFPSILSSITTSDGKAGDLTINTGKLLIQGGAEVSTQSSGAYRTPVEFIPAIGSGGNLTVNASESIELIGTTPDGLPGGLFAGTLGSGEAGKITIVTGQLIISDGAAITVSSELPKLQPNTIYKGDVNNLGSAGELNITARSILLDNQGKLTSNSKLGRGGDISLQVRDLLLMRRNSQISTNAGGDKTGGNITIKAPNGFLVATPFGNNDITANAFSGSGGKITITAKNIFGFVPRTRADVERLDPTGSINPNNLRTSDITAFSQQNPSLSGTVQINSPDADPSKGLVELPVNLVDASEQIAAGCNSGAKIGRSSFIATGRGGLVADPTQPLIADDAVLADWITLEPESKNRAAGIQKRAVLQAQQNTEEKSQKVNSVNEPTQIVEAQGWVMDANGNVVLVAQVPTASPHNSSLTATSCAAH
ncbi:filamentous hemagglutinin N-terminal domain-containing protein [Nostoc muscorum FACHB-395]|jgi:filamentous hemagglutinin family protein|uniref:two-partner secretion domain-containing protein n=1 Tax=Nostoc sp. C057 TaxID=2576903 RepID=UPI0015C365D1|nr:filamentous hemagglutinin N-terminal domain-containing protein [Nostoc sp. C057]MBD2507467.1 filamentous hemagglutinin N-terminal domain-containing protein [Desmonostoc muscorum FACHB-395]QLE46954.1 filamentous hemagglutinin N-terminal domain-containing protein [Nostoc sp. C057]